MGSKVTVLDRFCTEVGQGSIVRNPEVEKQLIRLYQVNGSERAKDILVKSCLRFVVKLAHRYAKGNVEKLTDLVAAGNEGLLVALERYDLRRTTRLLTYATSWILLYIRQELQRDSTVAVPVWHQHASRRLKKAQQKTASRTGKNADVKKLCRETGLSELRVERLLTENVAVVSIDSEAPCGTTMLDSLATNCENADSMMHREDVQKLVHLVVGKLPAPERNVLTMYFGLGGKDPMTSQQIGDQLGVSRERARQVQQRARSLFKKKLLLSLSKQEQDSCTYPNSDQFLCAAVI